MVAKARVAGGEAAFAVEDRWKVSGAVLSVSRKVSVTGAEDNAGFYSAIRLLTSPTVVWTDADYLVPGLLYGEPTQGRPAARRCVFPRETPDDPRGLCPRR